MLTSATLTACTNVQCNLKPIGSHSGLPLSTGTGTGTETDAAADAPEKLVSGADLATLTPKSYCASHDYGSDSHAEATASGGLSTDTLASFCASGSTTDSLPKHPEPR